MSGRWVHRFNLEVDRRRCVNRGGKTRAAGRAGRGMIER
jgi:hypothetical protein